VSLSIDMPKHAYNSVAVLLLPPITQSPRAVIRRLLSNSSYCPASCRIVRLPREA
jgi:hypothetical protein